MGYAYLLISLALVPLLMLVAVRTLWIDPLWAAALALTLLPAIWATLVGAGAAPCPSAGACISKSDQHRQLVAAPAIVLIALGVALLAFGVKRALAPCAIGAGVLAAIAETRTDVPGFWFLLVLVIAELAYAVVPFLQARAAAGGPSHADNAAQ